MELFLGGPDAMEGDFDAAAQRYRTSLSILHGMGNTMGTAWVLYSFGDLAQRCRQPERALRLVGASAALLDGEMPAGAMAITGDVGKRARRELDQKTAERSYREGLAMRLEEAVAYALGQEGA